MSHEREIVRRLLERDLVEQPALRLVWADLLQLDGDPLGRLVVLDHTAATASPEVARLAQAEAAELRERLRGVLWEDPPPRVPPRLPGVELDWELGFVRELRVTPERLTHEHTPQTYEWVRRRRRATEATPVDTLRWLVPQLVRQPAMRWLEVVRIDTDDGDAERMATCFERAWFASPILREIHVGRPAELRSRPGGQWEPHPNNGWSMTRYGDLTTHRQLRRVSLAGERVRIPCAEGNAQTKALLLRKLGKQGWTRAHEATLARALWDVSDLVREAAFHRALELGPAASFLVDELGWFLRPPLRPKDPRPRRVLEILAAIGPASASLLPSVLANPSELLSSQRVDGLFTWLGALGPAGAPARAWLERQAEGPHAALARGALARVRG